MNRTIRRVAIAAITAGITWSATGVGMASAVSSSGPDGSLIAQVSSVSCPSAGNFAAVGFLNASGITAFVVNQTRGTWGREQPVKGMAALFKGGAKEAELSTVSCSSPGNCSAGGKYFDHTGTWRPFVVTQTHGRWGDAKEIALPRSHPGRLNLSQVQFVSCQATGDCTAAGLYTDNVKGVPFVVTDQNGIWGKAEKLPGMASLTAGGATFHALSCASFGNCGAGGTYADAHHNVQAFVVTETNGTWGSPQQVPGTGAVNKGGRAFTQSVSCPAAGSCLAVGYYEDSKDGTHPFISSQKNGTWGHIQPVPGLAKLGTDLFTPFPQWTWCASAGNCAAIGSCVAGHGQHNFNLTEQNGTWGNAKKIRLGARSVIAITSVSCVSIGNCSASGYFTGAGSVEVFVITETNGTWGRSEEVPGSVALNRGGYANLYSVSCGAPGECAAGGVYTPKFGV